jgi:hypothetical protein
MSCVPDAGCHRQCPACQLPLNLHPP